MTRKTQKSASKIAVAQFLERRTLFAAFAPITFAPSTNFTEGSLPVGIVAADFNQDGYADLAVADRTLNKVNVFIGTGGGSFSAGASLAMSAPPVAIITGDFNADGRPDIAVATTAAVGQSTTAVDVFLNTGGGTFGLGQITTVETGATAGEPVSLAAGDFNNDKKLDLGVTEYTSQAIAILSGTGAGAFQAPVVYQANAYPTGITSADFNDDTYTDLAITSTSINFFAGQTNDGSASNQASLLIDNATGDFSAGPNIAITTTGYVSGLTAANLTAVTTPGLLVTSTDGTVSVLTNTGGNFAVSAVSTVNGGATGVAAGDFNLDGNTDFVAGGGPTSLINNSNSITVVPTLGAGSLSSSTQVSTGSAPGAVVVADFNNDGKPDIATANEGDGTVSVLLNSTAIPLVSTTVAVTSSGLSTPADSTVTFTATINSSSVSPLSGESLPTGTVKFFDGTTLLGTAAVVAGTAQAQFFSSDLIVGNHRIGVTYVGDTAYAASSSAKIIQVISPTATEGPDLVGTLLSSTLPTTLAPGESGVVKVQITNQGNSIAVGSIANLVYLSLDDTIDSGDTAIPAHGSLARASLHLLPQKSITLTGTITIPQGTPLAGYLLLVQLNTTASIAESVTTNDTVVSPSMYTVANVFGNVAGRAGVVLQTTDSNGTPATFRLTGPGSGTVNVTDDGVQITLDATSLASTLRITGTGSFIATSLSADSPIGSIRAPMLTVTNSLTFPGGITAITLGNAGGIGSTFTIGAGNTTTVSIGTATGLNLNTAGGIKVFSVGSYSGGSVTAGWIGTMHSTRNFTAGIALNGIGAPAGIALNSAVVGGVASGAWTAIGNIGRVSLGSVPASVNSWSLAGSGSLRSLAIGSALYGNVSAGSIGSVVIRGGIVGASLLSDANITSVLISGNLDTADVLAGITGVGTLGTVRITGSVTTSLVAAGAGTGAQPVVLSPDGKIKSLTVLGSIDSTSKFLAALLPKRAVLSGVAVMPASDPHFQIGV